MQLCDLVSILNKKVVVKSKRVRSVKKYYLSLYRASMIEMYDEGYISDPTRFNTSEIRRNLVDLDIKYLTDISGKVQITSEFIKYAMCRSKSDYEALRFLNSLYKAVYYKEISDNLDKFYDECGFAKGDKKKVSLNLSRSSAKITYRSGYIVDEGVLRCINSFGACFDFVSIREDIYKLALEELNLPDTRKDSLFVMGLSRDEEIEFVRIIFDGLVPLDGIYSKYLYSWLEKTKWSDGNRVLSQKDGLYEWVLRYRCHDVMAIQRKVSDQLDNEEKFVVSMASDGFYILGKPRKLEYPSGMFSVAVSDSEDKFLSPRNILEGYSGEVVLEEYLIENEINYVGCPIDLYYEPNKKDLFVDIEQTEFKSNDSWFKDNEVSIGFSESFYKEGKFRKDSLEDMLYRVAGNSESGSLIGYIPSGFSEEEFEVAKKNVYKGVLKE